MATSNDPGLRQRLYIGGVNLLIMPEQIQEEDPRAETAERTADAFTVIDRPYVLDGAPDVVSKFSWSLSWPRVKATDSRTFLRMKALPGFFDFCLWKPLCEIFSGDAARTTFYLLRRNALTEVPSDALPAGASTTYAVQAYINGALVSTPTFGTPDSRGVTPITFGSAPAAGSSNVEIYYVPLFYARVDSPRREFPLTHRETRSMTLVEI